MNAETKNHPCCSHRTPLSQRTIPSNSNRHIAQSDHTKDHIHTAHQDRLVMGAPPGAHTPHADYRTACSNHSTRNSHQLPQNDPAHGYSLPSHIHTTHRTSKHHCSNTCCRCSHKTPCSHPQHNIHTPRRFTLHTYSPNSNQILNSTQYTNPPRHSHLPSSHITNNQTANSHLHSMHLSSNQAANSYPPSRHNITSSETTDNHPHSKHPHSGQTSDSHAPNHHASNRQPLLSHTDKCHSSNTRSQSCQLDNSCDTISHSPPYREVLNTSTLPRTSHTTRSPMSPTSKTSMPTSTPPNHNSSSSAPPNSSPPSSTFTNSPPPEKHTPEAECMNDLGFFAVHERKLKRKDNPCKPEWVAFERNRRTRQDEGAYSRSVLSLFLCIKNHPEFFTDTHGKQLD